MEKFQNKYLEIKNISRDIVSWVENIAEENRKEDRKSDCASLHRFIHLLPALLPSASSFWKNGPVKQAGHPSVKCTYKEE